MRSGAGHGTFVLALVGALLAGCTPAPPERPATPTGGPSPQAGSGSIRWCPLPTEPGEIAFTLGEEPPVEELLAAIEACDCPQLAASGPMSGEHVCGGYLAGDDVHLRFDHGRELTYYADASSTEAEFVRETRAEFRDPGAPLPGRIVPFRGTRAGMLEHRDNGPAVVFWLEGSFEVALYGRGADRLVDVVRLGEMLIAPERP